MLIAEPEIKVQKLSSKSEFLVLMCDGIVDYQTNTEVFETVQSIL